MVQTTSTGTAPQVSGEYLQAIIDGLEDELLVIDCSFRIVHANRAVLKRHGKKLEDVIGQYCYNISHGSPESCHLPYHECPITRVRETGKTSRATHLHIYTNGGEQKECYVDIIASPVFDKAGKVAFVVELMRDVTEAKLLDIENARLQQKAESDDRVRSELLNQVFTIQEDERRRIARELHDDTCQSFAGIAASLQAIITTLPETEAGLKTRLKSLQTVSLKSMDEMRRLIYELRPSILDDFGLVAALRYLIDQEMKRTGIRVRLKVTGAEKRLPKLESTIFRVAQEAINNIIRHADASKAVISLSFKKNAIHVRITDDGRGFDVKEALGAKDRPRGLGLLGMRERVSLVNGSLIIRSEPGEGAEIAIEIPLEAKTV
ncbi:MAG: histidine kinase [Dehalococcoidia bacterium]|nr:histidine kinase [Dehalococcoidia bacterium]